MKQISIIQQLYGQPIVVACDSPQKVWLKVIANSPSCLSLDSQVIDHILIDVLDKRYFLPVRLNFLYHCIHWTGAAQILSQALLKVLLEGTQVNLELRSHGLVLNLYTPLFRLSSSSLATGLLIFWDWSLSFLSLSLLLLLEGLLIF